MGYYRTGEEVMLGDLVVEYRFPSTLGTVTNTRPNDPSIIEVTYHNRGIRNPMGQWIAEYVPNLIFKGRKESMTSFSC